MFHPSLPNPVHLSRAWSSAADYLTQLPNGVQCSRAYSAFNRDPTSETRLISGEIPLLSWGRRSIYYSHWTAKFLHYCISFTRFPEACVAGPNLTQLCVRDLPEPHCVSLTPTSHAAQYFLMLHSICAVHDNFHKHSTSACENTQAFCTTVVRKEVQTCWCITLLLQSLWTHQMHWSVHSLDNCRCF